MAISTNTYNSNYYDEYTGSIDIYTLVALSDGTILRADANETTAQGELLARATLGVSLHI